MKNEFIDFDENEKRAIVEAIIFASDEAIDEEAIAKIINEHYNPFEKNISELSPDIKEKIEKELISYHEITLIINGINEDLNSSGRPYRLVNFAGGWQFAIRSEYGELIAKFIKSKTKKRLSQAALETLAIIAYKQPISKPMIESIRGVNSNEVVNSLIDKSFVRISGKSETIGKPSLYSTTDDFLKHFGLNNIDDLPPLKELEEIMDSDDRTNDEMEIVIEINDEKLGQQMEFIAKTGLLEVVE